MNESNMFESEEHLYNSTKIMSNMFLNNIDHQMRDVKSQNYRLLCCSIACREEFIVTDWRTTLNKQKREKMLALIKTQVEGAFKSNPKDLSIHMVQSLKNIDDSQGLQDEGQKKKLQGLQKKFKIE